MTEQATDFNQDLLLTSFTQADVDSARAQLLERYHLWQGLLISENGKSVITPDDLESFTIQAEDIFDQQLKSEYELEQLKILTVLIYLLMDAAKSVSGDEDPNIKEKLEQLNFPNSKHFIARKVIHGASQLTFAEIQQLIDYENIVLASVHDPDDFNNSELQDHILTGLQSSDGQYFNLEDAVYELRLQETAAPTEELVPEEIDDEIEPTLDFKEAPAVARGDVEAVVLNSQRPGLLFEHLNQSVTYNGVHVAAACYIGLHRERNEDGVIIAPEHNQVLVIDAMGGYGNGVDARDIFIEGVLENDHNIDTSLTWTQKQYDQRNLDQGGVCIICADIISEDENFVVTLSQAGDVHAVLFDEQGSLRYESVDEAIGHQVINAIIGEQATLMQRNNGWRNFGELTRIRLRVRPGWRMVIYSDGIANHFNANKIAKLTLDYSAKDAISNVSQHVDVAMRQEKAYRDNCSIAIIDF